MADLDADRKLRALDHLPLPLVLLCADAETGELVVDYASARARTFFGAGMAVGQPLSVALPNLPETGHAALREVYCSGRPSRLYMPGGATGAAAPGLSFHIEPTLEPDGSVSGLLLSGAEARAEDALAMPTPEEAPGTAPIPTPDGLPTRPLPEALPHITYVISADGRRTEYLSPQWFAYTGQHPDAHEPTAAWAAVVHPDDISRVALTFGPARDTAQPWSSEVRLRRHDGEYCWFLCQSVPELDETGRVLRWLCISVDIDALHTTYERLRRREAQMRLLLETIPQFVWTADSNGGLTWVSEQWTRYTGLTLAQSAGGNWTSAVHPDDMRAAHSYWTATIVAGTDAEVHFRLREGMTGRYRWFVMRAQAQHDELGRPTGWFGTTTDVHELHETREQLKVKDQLLSQILNQAPAFIATLSGPNHRFTFTNPAYNELVSHRARLGYPVSECLPEISGQGFIALLDQVYRTGEPHADYEAKIELHDPNGGPSHETYLDFSYQPLRDLKGEVNGILSFGLDVGQRVRARQQAEALQLQVTQANAHLRHLTDALPLIIFTTDDTGVTTYMSPQWFAYTGQPAGGPWTEVDTWWKQVLHPEDAVAASIEIQSSISEGKLGRIELRLRGADGEYRWFMTEAVPDLDENGKLRQRYGYMLDIHDLRLAQSQLEIKDELLSQILRQTPAFIAAVSGPDHCFTFLNKAYDELMGHRAGLGQPAAECLPDVAAQGFIELLDQVRLTGQAYIGHEAPIELPDAVGELQRRYLDFTYQPLHTGEGELTSILAFAVDVTAQVQARQETERLQLALRQRDERLRTMTEALPQITFIATRTGGIEYISPQWYAYTGQAPDADVNGIWTDFIHPDDLPRILHELELNLVRTTPWRYEFRMRRHDGQYRWHLSRGVPEPGDTPGALPNRWYGSDTDVHELRELQEELHQGQARYQALTDKIPSQVWTADATGQLDFFNERAATYLGRDRSELTPTNWQEVVHPDDRARVAARWLDSVAHTRAFEAELRLRGRTGEYRWYLAQAAPALNEQGQVQRWYGTNTDIHAQRELEQTLRRSEEQFRFLAESLPQIVWTSSGVGGNDYINQRWFDYTGLDPATSGDRANWAAVIHPDDLGLTNSRWAHSVATGDFFEIEYRFRRHDGVYRWFLGQGRAQHLPDGSILKWFGTCTDIEDQKQSQQQLEAQNEQLRRSNHDLDHFVYTASHDLRQPINNMAGIFEELTRTAYFRDPDAVKLIAMFEKALQQIDDTIEDLSAIVQVQRRQQPVPTEPVALLPLTQDIIGSLQGQIVAQGARVELDFLACPRVSFVRAQLQSVLFNLLSNALKYAAPDRLPHIRISSALDPADEHPILTVQDNGLGIDMFRHGGQLFQLFSRFHTHVEGSGMGLYLVNRIVECHGGRIEVMSQVGEGTRFTIHLPGAERL
jgi:PAS domain S-box-containing protein